ncbi:MAG: L,D-transpeptidase family protein [Desulfobacterales bacterium]
MVRWQRATIAVMVLGALVSCAVHGYAASEEAYKNVFIEHLEMGPATYLNINVHGKNAADIDKRLTEIYYGNELQPFWIEDGKPGPRAADILAVLEDAESQGLEPASYFVDKIHQYWGSQDTAGLVRLDILLTLGMMRYVADQHEGRIEPREVDPELFATARDVEVDWDALRKMAFEAPDMKAFLDQQAPPFLQYRELQKKLAEYRALAAKGGWTSISAGETLKPGMENPRVNMVRKRLAVTGDLAPENMDSAVFDTALEEAVKRFQKRHNLTPDGAVGKQTLAAMNVPVETRIDQIVLNMERYRWLKRTIMGDRLVAVNIAGFEAVAGKAGKFDVTMPVIVGKTYHETPVFSDTIKYVVFNPYWNLTPSIARNETLPKLKKDSHYLKKHNMRIFKGWGPDAPELDATKIDWSKVSKKDMNRYRVRQDPGPDNALGTLKLVFPNKYNVYLHDTPAHGLFKKEQRAFSHGCIRMDRPAEMAAWVLGGEEKGWSLARVNEIIASRKRQVAVLDQPVPVYILYRTAFVNPEAHTLYFYEDIYGRDKLLAKALFGPGS